MYAIRSYYGRCSWSSRNCGNGRKSGALTGWKILGRLLADLDYTQIEEIKSIGLHEFLDNMQTRLNQIGSAVHETFFATPLAPAATQSQSVE